MKIFFTIPHLATGGAERVVSLLANHMVRQGHQIEIILLSSNRCSYSLDQNVSLIYAGDGGRKSFLCRLIWLRRYVKRENPDVVVSFLVKAYCFTLLSLLGIDVCKIVSERNDPKFTRPWILKVMRLILLPSASHFVVQTEKIKTYFSDRIRAKTSVILNPVSEQVFKQPNTNKEKVIITAGKLYPQKNHMLLIEAFSYIVEEIPDYQLHIYGDGPLRRQLNDKIRNLGLQNRIYLFERSDDIIEKMNRATLFCLASDYEGMSNSLIEAVCLGLPVVTTNVSGTESFMKNWENGIIVDCGNIKDFSIGIKTLLQNEELRSRIEKNNQSKAILFSTENISKQWETLFMQGYTRKSKSNSKNN